MQMNRLKKKGAKAFPFQVHLVFGKLKVIFDYKKVQRKEKKMFFYFYLLYILRLYIERFEPGFPIAPFHLLS